MSRLRVPVPRMKWYLVRAKQHLDAIAPASPTQQTAADVTRYLMWLGRRGRLADWQFVQVVQALELLYRSYLGLPWAETFDWAAWKTPGMKKPVDRVVPDAVR